MYSLMSTRMSAARIGEQELGQRARKLGLSDAGRAGEDERADRTVRILEPGAAAADRARERLDRLFLRDDRRVQLLFHAQQSRRLRFLETHHRNAGPTAHDERDLFLAEHRAVRLAMLLPLFLLAADLALQLALRVTQRRGALEVLVANGGFLLHVHAVELRLERRRLPAAAPASQDAPARQLRRSRRSPCRAGTGR